METLVFWACIVSAIVAFSFGVLNLVFIAKLRKEARTFRKQSRDTDMLYWCPECGEGTVKGLCRRPRDMVEIPGNCIALDTRGRTWQKNGFSGVAAKAADPVGSSGPSSNTSEKKTGLATSLNPKQNLS